MPLDDQIAQRRANFQALAELGVPLFPHSFERSDSVSALVAEYGRESAEALEALRPETRTAGRILGIRSFGKANFLVLSDGRATIQVYVRQDSVPERDFKVFKLLDFGDHVGVAGRVFRTR